MLGFEVLISFDQRQRCVGSGKLHRTSRQDPKVMCDFTDIYFPSLKQASRGKI